MWLHNDSNRFAKSAGKISTTIIIILATLSPTGKNANNLSLLSFSKRIIIMQICIHTMPASQLEGNFAPFSTGRVQEPVFAREINGNSTLGYFFALEILGRFSGNGFCADLSWRTLGETMLSAEVNITAFYCPQKDNKRRGKNKSNKVSIRTANKFRCSSSFRVL